jgi:hypothetical protein
MQTKSSEVRGFAGSVLCNVCQQKLVDGVTQVSPAEPVKVLRTLVSQTPLQAIFIRLQLEASPMGE